MDLTNLNDEVMQAIEDAGHYLYIEDKMPKTDNEIAVQAIIDNFDYLTYQKKIQTARIKVAASKKAADIYPFIDPETQDALGLYNFAEDLYTSIAPAARQALSGRLLSFKGVYDTATSGISTINAETDWTLCEGIANTTISQIEAL